MSILHVLAQNSPKDSIRQLLGRHTADDTIKIKLLSALANKYYYTDADSQNLIGKQLLVLSEKLDYTPGKIMALEAIGSSLFQSGKYDSALWNEHLALSLARQSHYNVENSMLYNNIANACFRLNKYGEALEYYDSAIQATANNPNKEMNAKVHSNVGNVYYAMGNYTKALKHYTEGLHVQEQIGVATNIASDLSNISNVYFRLGNYQKALEYNGKGMALNTKAGARINIIGNLTTYALIYDAEKQYDSCLLMLNEALRIATELKNDFMQNLLKSNIAECYLKKGEYDKAYPLYLESIAASQKMGDLEGLAIAKAGVGQTLIKQGETAKGISYLQEALKLMQENQLREQGMDIARKLGDAFKASGNYQQALNYFEIADEYEDSLSKDNSRKEVEQVMFNYELQKKEDRIVLLEKDNAIEQSDNKAQGILLIATLTGLLLAVIIAYQFFRNVRNEKKNSVLMLQQKEEIQHQATRLQELNDFKDNTFSILSHDLRSPVNALSSTLMMLDEKLITPEEFGMYKQELHNKLESVSLLLDNLLYWSQNQMKGEHRLDVEKLYIRRKALKTIAVLKDAAAQKSITLVNNVPDGIIAYADKNHIEIAMRNLVSNAIKFTPVNGTVTIDANTKDNVTEIKISDTGIGMPADQVAKLFSGSSNESTAGTMGEKGTGLGLRMSYEFAKRNGGDITVISTPSQGTIFTISLPAFTHDILA